MEYGTLGRISPFEGVMFRGTIPAAMRSIVAEAVNSWAVSDVFVGCSGNFTIERLIAGLKPDLRIHGNDVTLYSCSIDHYFAGNHFELALNWEYADKFGWVEEFCDTSVGQLSCLMLGSTMMQSPKSDNVYYQRLRQGYRDQWAHLYKKTVEQFEASTLKLASFHSGDVVEWVDQLPRDSAFVCFPPFYSGDYEAQFRHLDAVFEWDEPMYTQFDHARLQLLFQKAREFKFWMVGNNVRWPEMEQYLCGKVLTTNRGVPIYIYSNASHTRLVSPHQETDALMVPHLAEGQTIGDNLTICNLTLNEFSHLRSIFMNSHIKPGSPGICHGVLVDGFLVGCYAYVVHVGSHPATIPFPGPTAYLLSDFPVAPTNYSRLAKLVLYAALSHESRVVIEQYKNMRFRSVLTTAYTSLPVSMKYRGLFALASRKESVASDVSQSLADAYLHQGYQLNYASMMGRWSLAEGMTEWKAKHMKGK